MRVLFLTHSFNSLAQRLYVELVERGHEVSIEFDVHDRCAVEAADLFAPDLVIAPFLKRAIPEAVWRRHVCLVVHPGIVGDRGPSALDWAILDGEAQWGVTVLQADAEMDAGDVWAARSFPMRAARKSSLYRNEVTEAAVAAVLEAVEKLQAGDCRPVPVDYRDPAVRGRPCAPMRQAQRRIDWQADSTATALAKIRSADSVPGVLDEVLGLAAYLYHAVPEACLRGAPGEVIAQREGAICRATTDGALWITHLKAAQEQAFKLPAAQVLGARLAPVPDSPLPALPWKDDGTWQPVAYEEQGGVGFLHFPFYNGALSAADCLRLRDAFLAAARRDTRAIVLMGGPDFWCNGVQLNVIEAAESPAEASWENIVAMDELCLALIECDRLLVSALQGNAGAGGVFLALAADEVWAREGVVLNPHYKGMGNLYGSEYWTYLLPRRVGEARAAAIMDERLPLGAAGARRAGLIDDCFGADVPAFAEEVRRRALALAGDPRLGARLADKRERRARDEAQKPLQRYRDEELSHMKLNFYGFDPSYHVARYHFVHRVPHAWTPLHLARHRQDQWRRQSLLKNRD